MPRLSAKAQEPPDMGGMWFNIFMATGAWLSSLWALNKVLSALQDGFFVGRRSVVYASTSWNFMAYIAVMTIFCAICLVAVYLFGKRAVEAREKEQRHKEEE